MVVRVWEGHTTIEHSDIYRKLIVERDIPNYKSTPGFVKLSFLERSDSEHTYFKLLTYWADIEAVKTFTGPGFEVAKAYAEDEQ